jgi:hypothetical protein
MILELSKTNYTLVGVVGWVDLQDPKVPIVVLFLHIIYKVQIL